MKCVAVLAAAALLTGCGHPDGTAKLHDYTGISLCPGARVNDLTTPEEGNTYPSFSIHLELRSNAACDGDFRRALARTSPQECSAAALRRHGCTIRDLARQPGRHATMLVVPGARGEYDVRIYG